MRKKTLPNSAMDEASKDFESMYKTTHPLIYRFMFWRTKDEMLAQDLTSTVYEKAWRSRGSFTGGSAKAWLYRIARTTLIDYWRKKKEILDDGSLTSQVASEEDLPDALDKELAIEMLHNALLKLPAEMHNVVQLRFIEGKSARETAAYLHLTETNVRVIQFRALKKLKGYLQ